MLIDHNPLVVPVLEMLQAQAGPVSEHELITLLRPQLVQVEGLSQSGQLALFQTHFLVMNALYQLQRDLLTEGYYLSISPLAIMLEPVNDSGSSDVRDASDIPLGQYYLDFANLQKSDEQSVEQLLNSFWQRYLAQDKRQEALTVLGLAGDTDWGQIKKAYRQKAAQLHPDRGGDAQQFMQIREAFELLRCARDC